MNEATSLVPRRSSILRVEFDLSATDNFIAPLGPALVSVWSENE
jgi:hypothetical protein